MNNSLPIVLCAAAAMLLGPVYAEDVDERIGDWQLLCLDSGCRIRQGLSNPQRPDIKFGSEINILESTGQTMLTLSFPLGIYLPSGVGLKVGETTRNIPVVVCLPTGCQAIVIIGSELRAALAESDSYTVRYYATKERPVEIEFSLDGYANAYQQLIDRQ